MWQIGTPHCTKMHGLEWNTWCMQLIIHCSLSTEMIPVQYYVYGHFTIIILSSNMHTIAVVTANKLACTHDGHTG